MGTATEHEEKARHHLEFLAEISDLYPAKLMDLAPRYIPSIPKDVFGDADFHYIVQRDGYLLYSVGLNGRDDGGRQSDDDYEAGEVPGDDITIRMPVKP